MGNATCQSCGWFNPEKDGSFFCPCKMKTVRKFTKHCEFLENVKGMEDNSWQMK